MPPARKLNRHETTVARVAQLIAAGVVLTAHNAVAREESTVGPYHEAVDRGIKFACLSTKGRAPERMARSAEDAADGFVCSPASRLATRPPRSSSPSSTATTSTTSGRASSSPPTSRYEMARRAKRAAA